MQGTATVQSTLLQILVWEKHVTCCSEAPPPPHPHPPYLPDSYLLKGLSHLSQEPLADLQIRKSQDVKQKHTHVEDVVASHTYMPTH